MRNTKNVAKRVLSALLTLTMVLSMAAVPVFAASYDGAEFDEQASISGEDVATYAANPDAFVEDADSSDSDAYQTGMTVYVVTDNGAPSGKSYTAAKAYDESKVNAISQIDTTKTFNSYLVYNGTKLDGVLFIQDDAGAMWKTIVASMLNGKKIEGLVIPQTIPDVEASYNQKTFTADKVEEIAGLAPSEICVTDLLVYVMSIAHPEGAVFGTDEGVAYFDFGAEDYTSYLVYDGRVLTGILFVQNEMDDLWIVDALVLCDGMTVKGLDKKVIKAFDEKDVSGEVVQLLSMYPDLLPFDLSILVVNDIERVEDDIPQYVEGENGRVPFGRVFTVKEPYEEDFLTIDFETEHRSYICYDKNKDVAGILFVEKVDEPFEWLDEAVSLLGEKWTIKGIELPREYPEVLSMAITVKENATAESIQRAAYTALLREYKDYPIGAIDWSDVDFSVPGAAVATIIYENDEMASVIFMVTIEPVEEWNFAETVAEIKSTSEHNKNAEALLVYVNQDMIAKPVASDAYKAAMGTAETMEVPAFTWEHCDKEYTAKGDVVYTFEQIYKGIVFTRTLVVVAANYEVPDLKIDYSKNTVNTVLGMKWSLEEDVEIDKWYPCIEDMAILKDWVGETVYFVMAGTEQAGQSKIVKLDIPDYAEEPDCEPELIASSHSITITNLDDFDDVEFSLDGKTWIQPELDAEVLTFKDLKPDTEYTVYVRTCAWDGIALASKPVTNGIYTSEEVKTEFDLDYEEVEDELGSITLDISLIAELEDEVLLGALTESDFAKFSNVLSKYLRKYDDVEVVINIEQALESGVFADYDTVRMTIPYSVLANAIAKADTEVTYKNDMVVVALSQEVLEELNKKSDSINLTTAKVTEAPSSSTLKWIKEQLKAGSDVYHLIYRCDSTELVGCEVTLPVEDVNSNFGIVVTHVTSRGVQTEIEAEYDAKTGTVTFIYEDDGYYVITRSEKPSEPMNYYDVSITFWGYEGISYCYENGIMIGTDTNTFSPNNYVSKAQIITMLARLAGADVDKAVTSTGFADVSTDSWYAAAAKWAKDNGIVIASYFDGDAAVTRQEIAGLLYAYLTKVEKITVNSDSLYMAALYDDANLISAENQVAVRYTRLLGIMNGVGDNRFNPDGYVTRAQIATIAMRVDVLVNN